MPSRETKTTADLEKKIGILELIKLGSMTPMYEKVIQMTYRNRLGGDQAQ